jgi:hypothetical protein
VDRGRRYRQRQIAALDEPMMVWAIGIASTPSGLSIMMR